MGFSVDFPWMTLATVRFQDDFDGGKWRLLALDLAVGDQKFKAQLTLRYASELSLLCVKKTRVRYYNILQQIT